MTGKNRRTIMGGDAPMYHNARQIEGYYEAADIILPRKVKGVFRPQPCPYPEESQRCFLTLWITGCREGESVMLTTDQWKWNDEAILGVKIPILKKREKVRDAAGDIVYKAVKAKIMRPDGTLVEDLIYRPMTRRKLEYRDHLVPADMPLGQKFIDMVHELRNDKVKYLLFKRKRFTREIVKKEATSTRSVSNRITELHPDLFPHGIRALNVRFLKDRFGDDFDTPELKDHFKWSSTEMAVYYLSGQKLAKAMGIRKIPT